MYEKMLSISWQIKTCESFANICEICKLKLPMDNGIIFRLLQLIEKHIKL